MHSLQTLSVLMLLHDNPRHILTVCIRATFDFCRQMPALFGHDMT